MDLIGLMLLVVVGLACFVLGQSYQRTGRLMPLDFSRLLPPERDRKGSALLWFACVFALLFLLALARNLGSPHSADAGSWMFFAYSGFGFCMAAWVYQDARERGGRASAWAGMVLVTNVFGLVGYFISRPERPRTCMRCGFRLREEYVVCPYCGPQAGLTCLSCQGVLEPDWQYCPYCQVPTSPPMDSMGGGGGIAGPGESSSESGPPSSASPMFTA
ncbi:MAG TPA: zinc ribbon domain-containing protein [Armatimonadota bacterium]|jgi:hypothetical protein